MVPNERWKNGVIPPRDYLEYRGKAVYGIPLSELPAEEFLRYLEWCKAFPAAIR